MFSIYSVCIITLDKKKLRTNQYSETSHSYRCFRIISFQAIIDDYNNLNDSIINSHKHIKQIPDKFLWLIRSIWFDGLFEHCVIQRALSDEILFYMLLISGTFHRSVIDDLFKRRFFREIRSRIDYQHDAGWSIGIAIL